MPTISGVGTEVRTDAVRQRDIKLFPVDLLRQNQQADAPC